MKYAKIGILVVVACSIGTQAQSQSSNRCADLKGATLAGVEITNAKAVPAGKTIASAYPGASAVGPLPAHCRVDGMINRRKGSDGEEFGIGFSIALPEPSAWNGDFLMQGGGGGNGVVAYPTGASFTGDKPALSRGFAVASTDSGHQAKTGGFDFTFMRDQQAYLDFA
ncbi:MAG: tannase/feruloyl esterase family alpha/beta hydrolase, partial [Acidobacteriaceae bacterium]